MIRSTSTNSRVASVLVCLWLALLGIALLLSTVGTYAYDAPPQVVAATPDIPTVASSITTSVANTHLDAIRSDAPAAGAPWSATAWSGRRC